MSGES